MIKIEKSDNILDIISKIKKLDNKDKKIILQFPFWHKVLYDKVALQSIKEACKNRKLVIKSNDILSKKVWEQLGIKYNIEKKIESEVDLVKYNYWFFEYLIYEIKNLYNIFKELFFKKAKLDPRKKFLKYYKQKSQLPIFIWVLFITILIFFYVFFFALNKTYVYITPDIQVKNKAQNFVFTEKDFLKVTNNNKIKLKEFSKNINLEKTISTTWIKQNDRYKAKGTVEIYNHLETEIKLKDKTRLKSENWIIYETMSWVVIPPWVKNKSWVIIPWTKKVDIIAKLKDEKWNVIWARWNNPLKNIKLSIPWLDKEYQKSIYAKSITQISSWEDKYERVVDENDLENSKKVFIENLKKEAVKQIQREIEIVNKENNIKYHILEIDNLYKFSNIEVEIPDLKIWEKIKEYKIKWSIKVKTYAFNIDSIISKLKNVIEKSLLAEKEELLYINDNSLNIESKVWIIYRNENPLEVKASVEVEYNVKYNFKEENNNYINRLKQTISWMEKTEAEKRLINENLISNASVEIRPFFVNKVSNYFNNIEFIVKD